MFYLVGFRGLGNDTIFEKIYCIFLRVMKARRLEVESPYYFYADDRSTESS